MNWTRLALIAAVAALGWAAWPRHQTVSDTHTATRQFVITATLARVDDAVVVLGDSIVEASTLPRAICGHPIVNAGIGGATTDGPLGEVLKTALAGKRAAMVVVSLGTNDAARPDDVARYRAHYRALLGLVSGLTARTAILQVPSPESGFPQAVQVSAAVIDGYNAMLPDLARETGAALIPLPAMPPQHTLDGIHLNAAGYAVWDAAILQGVAATVCKAG